MKLKKMILSTSLAASLIGSFLLGKYNETKKHERDRVLLSVAYVNMPQVSGKAREPQVSIHGYFGEKEFRLQNLGDLAIEYDPRKPKVPELQSNRDLYKKILLYTSPSFTIDENGREMPQLKELDFKVESSFFDNSGELGDSRCYVFSIIPK